MTSRIQVRIIILSREVGCEMSPTTFALCNFVNKNSNWLIFFGKCYSLIKIQTAFHAPYSLYEPLIFL